MRPEIVVAVSTVLCSLLAFLDLRSRRENRRLRWKYRQALKDCRAFYEIEARLCAAVVAGRWEGPLPYEAIGVSELAIKRIYRLRLRQDGMESPSANATPQRIAEELAKL